MATILTKFFVTLITAMCGLNMAPCIKSPPKMKAIIYTLPAGWRWFDSDHHLKAITPGGIQVEYRRELSATTDADAKVVAFAEYSDWQQGCANIGGDSDCFAIPEYREMKFGKQNVYVLTGKFAGDSAYPLWGSDVIFAKDGYVITFLFDNGRADHYIPQLREMIRTTKFVYY